MATLGELVIELGVIGDTKKLEVLNVKLKEAGKTAQETAEKFKKTDNGVKTFIKSVGAIAGAIAAAAVAINKLTDDLVRSNQSLLDLTRTTDIAQSSFQKWGSIGKMLGIENADQQLASLNERLFELRLTGEGARGFQLAGINPMGQDAEGVLEQLRTRVKGMNDTTATYLLKQMGLDPRMLHLLRMGREEFEELGRTIKKYQLTPEQTKQIQEMNIQLQIAGIKLRYLRDRAILALMPYWVKFMESFARVSEGLAIFVKWLKEGSGWGPKLAKGILGVAAAVGVLKLAIWALTTHPIVATITAILGAIYLLIDDIVGYFQGKESTIGLLIGYFDELKESFKTDDISDSLTKLLEPVKALAKYSFPWAAQIIAAAQAGLQLNKQLREMWNNRKSDKGNPTGGAAPVIGYNGTLPDLNSMNPTPAMQQNVSNSSSNTTNQDNRISMNNYIQTSQPVADIERQILYAQFRQNASVPT